MNAADDHYIRVCTLNDAPPHVKALCPVDEETRRVQSAVGWSANVWMVVSWKNEWKVQPQGELVANLLSGRSGARYSVESNDWRFVFVSVVAE